MPSSTPAPHPAKEQLHVTIDGYRYDVTDFAKKHPGGNVIKFYCADQLDATDAFWAFHVRSEKAQKWLATLPREKVSSPDDARDPLVADFRKLRQDLWNEGFYVPRVGVNILRALELLLIYALSFYVASFGYWLLGGLVRALYLARNGLFMHDAGHRGIAGDIKKDRIWHWIIFTLGASASPTFWTNQHNKHHAATQELEHDIDLNTLPLIAFNDIIAKDGNTMLMRIQHITFIPAQLLLFFLWKFTHTRHSFRTKNTLEITGLLIHHIFEFLLYSYLGVPLLGQITVTCVGWAFGGLYLATIFSLNHTHRPVAEKYTPRDWVRRAALHTTNLVHSPINTWITGYLNYQIEHHLFPNIPHPQLPYVQPRVKALLQKHNVIYDIEEMSTAFKMVFGNLYKVGHSVPVSKKD